ncbi:MAG: GIY-YIG nuclease family protein, partial [Terrimicrobiaceae bacterium]|nr:GIY-YIG nuclease family protein [Terrimicrobiaceae bacterium]
KPPMPSCFVYVLRSQSHGGLYIGSSAHPDQRLLAHNAGKVPSTKAGRPWLRVWLEPFPSRAKALDRERYLKSGWGRKKLQSLLRNQERWQSG